MSAAIDPVNILVPMLVPVALTFIAFVGMAAARGKTIGQMDPAFYKAQLGGHEPESTVVAVRHYGNLLELPTLFYAACITAFVLGAVNQWTIGFAWAWVSLRVMQSGIHMTYNNPAHRGIAFVLGVLVMLALWVTVAMAIFARL